MSEIICSVFYTIFLTIIYNLFVGIFEERRRMKKVLWWGLQVVFAIFSHLSSYLLQDEVFLRIGLAWVEFALTYCVLYQVKFLKSLLYAFLSYSIIGVVEYLLILIIQSGFHMTAAEVTESSTGSTLLGILCLMVVFCIILVMKKTFAKKKGAMLTEAEWIRFSMFPCFSIISTIAMVINFNRIEDSQQGLVLIGMVCGLFLMNILLFGLLNDAIKREGELAEYRLIQERAKNETEMYRSISDNYDRQRKAAHEFKNHMACITALAEREEYDELRKYLDEMHVGMEKEADQIDTGHTLINAILNSKYQEAKQKGILFVIKVNDLSSVRMEEQDIVILLSNLLNNAFEACAKCDKKVVKLKFVREEKQIILSVFNYYAFEPVRQGERYLTSKEEPELHGIGIENIKDVVDKYNGTYAIRCEEGQFQFSILLPILQEKG